MKVIGCQKRRDAVASFIVDEDSTQKGLLGLQIMGRLTVALVFWCVDGAQGCNCVHGGFDLAMRVSMRTHSFLL
jgi:hypothetical protein